MHKHRGESSSQKTDALPDKAVAFKKNICYSKSQHDIYVTIDIREDS